MTRMLALFAAVLIGGLSLKQPAALFDAATPQCGLAKTQPGAAGTGAQDVRCTLVAQQAAAPGPPPAARTSIGMNLVAASYYSSAAPFIDRMRDAGEWFVHYPGNSTGPKPGGYESVRELKLPVDANGIPLAIPAGVENIALQIGYDPLDAGTTRRYVLLYEGTIQYIYGPGLKHIQDKPGRLTFEMSEFPSQQLAFSGTFKNVHNIHIVREDQLALFQAGKVFNPAFLDRVKLFSPIRFMDWGNTNGNMLVSWDQRLQPTNYSWAINTGAGNVANVPVEVMVQLANEAHVEPWFCIPAHADDDYVRKFVTYVRDNLAGDLKPHFEYSNEVWNGSFEQALWARAQGKAIGAPDWHEEYFYGYRAAQIATIARSILGDRARMVISSWTGQPLATPWIFQGIARVGDTSKLFDEYAVTTYWGGSLNGGTDRNRAIVVGWAKSGQAGIDAAFDALTIEGNGALESNSDSLPRLATIYAPHAAFAKQYGLDLVAYEGGFGAVGYAFGADQDNVVKFFTRLQASPRMATATARMATDFFAAGGKELTYFNDVGGASVHGTWGATPTIYSSSPTLEALKGLSTKP